MLSVQNNEKKTTEDFFHSLYGDGLSGHLTLWVKQDKLTRWFTTSQQGMMVAIALNLGRRNDVYFGICPRREHKEWQERGNSNNTASLPALWLDLDCLGENHKALNLPAFEEALEFIKEFPLPPSITVFSGGGLHNYWLLDSPWVFNDDSEQTEAGKLEENFQKGFIQLAENRNWSIDNTSDLARVLRVPGTFNHKSDTPVAVKLLEFHPEIRYTKEELKASIEELTEKANRSGGHKNPKKKRKEQEDNDKPNAVSILERCRFLRHCRDDAENLPEPDWYSMLTIIARTNGGNELCHELSRSYPDYSEEETEKKISHALNDTGPYTCAYIRENFSLWCEGCTESVTSPILLGLAESIPRYEKVLPFPFEALPDCLVPLVTEGAKANCCPPDFIAIPALTILGAAIGNSRRLQVKDGWTFKANLYTCIVAPPGSGKSPAQALAATPVKELQERMAQEYQTAKDNHEMQIAQWEYERDMAKSSKKPKPIKPKEPVINEIFTTDTTVEALALVMENNSRGIIIILDELSAWVKGLNQYKGGHGSDREHYLSFWSGSTTKVNRASKERREPIILSNPFLAVTGCIPPGVLSTLTDEGHDGEDGFVHRLLFSYPDPVPQRWTDETISQSALVTYKNIFQELWHLQPQDDGKPIVLKLTPEAYDLWWECFDGNAMESEEPDFPQNLKGPWAKMPSQAARLALIIQCCKKVANETNSEAVDRASIEKAWSLIDYFKGNARRVYKQLKEDPSDKLFRNVLEYCRKHRADGIAPRDLIPPQFFRNSEEAQNMLDTFERMGLGCFKEVGGSRGPKGNRFFPY